MLVTGITVVNDKWIKYKAIYDACMLTDVDVPDKVREFFKYKNTDSFKQGIDLCDFVINTSDFIFEINMSDIPKEVTKLIMNTEF